MSISPVQKAWFAVEEIKKICHEWSNALVVAGSLMISPSKFRTNSDVDLLILVRNHLEILDKMPGLQIEQLDEARVLLERGSIDGISTKIELQGSILSLSFFQIERFSELASLQDERVVYYRTTSNYGPVELRSFDGSSIRRKIVPQKYGKGYVVHEHHITLFDNQPYFGIMPEMLLSYVHVCFDEGSFAVNHKKMWISAIKMALQAGEQNAFVRAKTLINRILATKVKRASFSSHTLNHITNMVKNIASELGTESA